MERETDSSLGDSHSIWTVEARSPLPQLSSELSQRSPKVLRLRAHFDTARELHCIFSSLAEALTQWTPPITLLQVVYRPETLTPQARRLHFDFAQRHPRVSTYLPLCLPPSPLGQLVEYATPDQCSSCLFREGGRCDGLGGDEPSLWIERAGGALRPDWSGDEGREAFQEDPPLCYWWPEDHIIIKLREQISRSGCLRIWDIGGGNAYLLSRLGEGLEGVELICLDPVAEVYPKRDHILQLSYTAEEALAQVERGQLDPPDALCISWPSSGLSFQSLIHALRPKILIRATDSDGVCGVRRGHYSAQLTAEEITWFRLAEAITPRGALWDDMNPPMGYQVCLEERVWTYRDLRAREGSSATGLLSCFTLE